ncbi:MAG: hypothetical protein H7A12_03425 [Pseudomonadales bacterium]|jgi:hypothetical protein|nr:hypothetical protein [Pseudomonadales bacterium]MCP5319869.1 hypothetical protein [Pseudomonadales bacterium]MCP5337873.1 hypothetical protein [Pseudomonadales bacterium]
MPPLPRIEIESDKRILKDDYCNYDLIARYWDDEYRGRAWKNKQRVVDCDGTDLDEIMQKLRSIVDDIQAEKRRQRGRRKPSSREIADAILAIESKLSRAQKMMLVIHGKSPGYRISVRAIARVGDYASPEAAFEDYAEIARRICDELAYLPGQRRKDQYPGITLLFNEEIVIGSVTPETTLTLRPEIVKTLELLAW